MNSVVQQIDWEKCAGLVPAIVQHTVTGRVLMLGYMNQEALRKTETERQVTFFSRTKNRLWTKGETSGNTLELVGMEIDCDRDSVLVLANPQGPTCHNLTNSCFDRENDQPGFGFIGQLESIIRNRASADSGQSYTASLLKSGVRRIAQKVGEEGVEVALASTGTDSDKLKSESADLIFHLLVLLNSRDLAFADVVQTLADRNVAR